MIIIHCIMVHVDIKGWGVVMSVTRARKIYMSLSETNIWQENACRTFPQPHVVTLITWSRAPNITTIIIDIRRKFENSNTNVGCISNLHCNFVMTLLVKTGALSRNYFSRRLAPNAGFFLCTRSYPVHEPIAHIIHAKSVKNVEHEWKLDNQLLGNNNYQITPEILNRLL